MERSLTRRQWFQNSLAALTYLAGTRTLPGASNQTATEVVKVVRDGSFKDGFETDKGWGLFEEIVTPDCYVAGIGEVSRSRVVSQRGDFSLLVHANKQYTSKSNHLLANKRLANHGRGGRWAYCASAYISPETADTGQVGPEFSMQNTRLVGTQFLTTIAGLQYRANPFLSPPEKNSLAIWVEVSLGRAQWLQVANEILQPATWYRFCLEADFDQNRYVQLSLRGGGLDRQIDLSEHRIAEETRWSEEAFWLTLEAQNLWSCQYPGVYEYKVFYDNVRLTNTLIN